MILFSNEIYSRIKFAILLLIGIQFASLMGAMALYMTFFIIYLSFHYYFSFSNNFQTKDNKILINSFSAISFLGVMFFGPFFIFYFLINNVDESFKLLFEIIMYVIGTFSLTYTTCFLMKKYYNINEIIFFVLNSKNLKFKLTNINILAFLLSFPFIIVSIISKIWLFNNLISLTISFYCLTRFKFTNFKILLMFIFISCICEIFLVYYSDEIVKNMISLQGPWKLIIPLNISKGSYSFLGIFDLIIPCYISNFFINYDIDNCIKSDKKEIENKHLIYFNYILTGLFVGLLFLYTVIINSFRPQSVLCFVIPSMMLSLLFLAKNRKELNKIFEYKNDELNSLKNE